MSFIIPIPLLVFMFFFSLILIWMGMWVGKSKWFNQFMNNVINKFNGIKKEKEYAKQKRGK